MAALRPGGWLVLEDFDWLRPSAAPNCVGGELMDRAHDGARQLLAAAGYREDYGVALPGEMRSAGLVDIGAEGRAAVGVPGSPATAWWQLTVTKWCAGLIELGCVTAAEADELLGPVRRRRGRVPPPHTGDRLGPLSCAPEGWAGVTVRPPA